MGHTTPNLEHYRRHLLRAAWFIAGHRDARRVDGLVESMAAAVRQLSAARQGTWSLTSEPQWTFPLDWSSIRKGLSAQLSIGVNIVVERGTIDQHVVTFTIVTSGANPVSSPAVSCCIREVGEAPRVIRKGHFDVDVAPGGKPRPMTHFQLGGRPPPQEHGITPHYCFDQYLDLPRIPLPPMDPVLVIEFLLAQFTCPAIRTMLKERDWAGLVHRSQELWLEPFYRTSAKLLTTVGDRISHYEFQCERST